jgi:aspartyl-tRNA(Asn)/glutamyl-tRNA(Gln) amidotransferase subunit C
MEVNDVLVDKLAHLARLQFNEAEKQEIKKDLQQMISFVEKLNELDVSTVQPLMHITDETNVLREDDPDSYQGKTSISREDGLKNAPHNDGIFFKVPKVIKNPSTSSSE